jgi:hypothetical protein
MGFPKQTATMLSIVEVEYGATWNAIPRHHLALHLPQPN